jgi:hypothetical protein
LLVSHINLIKVHCRYERLNCSKENFLSICAPTRTSLACKRSQLNVQHFQQRLFSVIVLEIEWAIKFVDFKSIHENELLHTFGVEKSDCNKFVRRRDIIFMFIECGARFKPEMRKYSSSMCLEFVWRSFVEL